MYDVSPGWHTTINPIYYISGKLFSILAFVLLVSYIAIKIFKVRKDRYQKPMNMANLIFCILGTFLIASYLFDFAMAYSSGFLSEQFSFLLRGAGPYWILYMALMWIPLLLTQLFWRKKNRVNINLALFILFMSNMNAWIEWIYVVVSSFMKQ